MFENFVHKTGEWFLQLDSRKNFKFHTFIKRAQDKRPHANQRKLKTGTKGTISFCKRSLLCFSVIIVNQQKQEHAIW